MTHRLGVCLERGEGVEILAAGGAQQQPRGFEQRRVCVHGLLWSDKSNVARLRIVWRRPSLDAAILAVAPQMRAAKQFRSTPLMIDGVPYAPNAVGFVEAFDPSTGKTLWVEPPLELGGGRDEDTEWVALSLP